MSLREKGDVYHYSYIIVVDAVVVYRRFEKVGVVLEPIVHIRQIMRY